jgi:hypothetical protein
MADRNRRNTFAAVVVPFLFLAMAGLARAAGTVTNCTTFGPAAGTLEAALMGGGSVTFACSGTIVVPEIDINSGTTSIDATGQSVTLSGNNTNRVFLVASGATLNLQNLTVADAFFPGNGGGIFSFGTLTVANSTFSDNHVIDDSGGGIFNSGTATITNSTFSDNTAAGGGGGIFNFGTLTVTNSTFSGNTAASGAGIFNHFDTTLTVTNSTFSGNSSQVGGGGILTNLATLTVTNSTFSGNSAGPGGSGGGIEIIGGSVTLRGTILAAEAGGNCVGTITDAGYNISDDGSCGFTVAPIGTSINNSTTLNLDPLGLQNNGGPTQTIALEPNSQAVDFIPVASCAVTTDQRGFPRPDSGNTSFCDAGAFELQTGRITVVPGSEKTQIARSMTANSDQVNMAFSFIDHGSPILDDFVGIGLNCDAGTNAFNGVDVSLFEGTCADLATASGGLELALSPFVVHTVNGHSYGTLFQKPPTVPSPETVSVRIVKLPTPLDSCGEWTLNIQVTGLDTAAIDLGGSNPFALVVEDSDKNEGCFDVDNAIVGSQISPPSNVRRGARR